MSRRRANDEDASGTRLEQSFSSVGRLRLNRSAEGEVGGRISANSGLSPEHLLRMMGQQRVAGPLWDVDYPAHQRVDYSSNHPGCMSSVDPYDFIEMSDYFEENLVEGGRGRGRGATKSPLEGGRGRGVKKSITRETKKETPIKAFHAGKLWESKTVEMRQSAIMAKMHTSINRVSVLEARRSNRKPGYVKLANLYQPSEHRGTHGIPIYQRDVPALFMINAAPDPITVLHAVNFFEAHGDSTVFGFCAPYSKLQPIPDKQNAAGEFVPVTRNLYEAPANVRAQHTFSNRFNHNTVDDPESFLNAQQVISECVKALMDFVKEHEIITIFSSPPREARCVHVEKQNAQDIKLQHDGTQYASPAARQAENSRRQKEGADGGAVPYIGPIECYSGNLTSGVRESTGDDENGNPLVFAFEGRTPHVHASSDPATSLIALHYLLRPSYAPGLFTNVPLVANVDDALETRTDYGATFLVDLTAFATIISCLEEIKAKRITNDFGIPELYEFKYINGARINTNCSFLDSRTRMPKKIQGSVPPLNEDGSNMKFPMCEVSFENYVEGSRGYIIALHEPANGIFPADAAQVVAAGIRSVLEKIMVQRKMPGILRHIEMIVDCECNDVDDRSAILLAAMLMKISDGTMAAFPVARQSIDLHAVTLWDPIGIDLRYFELFARLNNLL